MTKQPVDVDGLLSKLNQLADEAENIAKTPQFEREEGASPDSLYEHEKSRQSARAQAFREAANLVAGSIVYE